MLQQASPTATKSPRIADELIKEGDLARDMGIHPRTLRRWEELRIGPPRLKIAKQIYYRRDAVLRWLQSREGKRA